MDGLPESNNTDFWGEDADSIQVRKQKTLPSAEHYLVWKGPYAVCISCPFEHTVPLDRKKYKLVEGKPCKI
jgi:hypothetical protein